MKQIVKIKTIRVKKLSLKQHEILQALGYIVILK